MKSVAIATAAVICMAFIVAVRWGFERRVATLSVPTSQHDHTPPDCNDGTSVDQCIGEIPDRANWTCPRKVGARKSELCLTLRSPSHVERTSSV